MAILALSSCLGVVSDVTVAQDGSGTAALELRVSALAANMGQGNVSMPSLPIITSRASWDAVSAPGSGITLISYSEQSTETEKIVSVRFSFSSLENLVTALNANAPIVSLARSGTSKTLSLAPFTDEFRKNPTVVSLFKDAFSRYGVSIRFTLKDGTVISTTGAISRDRKEVTLTAPIHELVSTQSRIWLAISF